MTDEIQSPPTVVRISLRWVIGALVVMMLFGMLGALVVQQVLRQPLPPLVTDGDRLVTTVQEVTISPGQARAQLVEAVQASTVLLVRATSTAQTVGTGVVLSRDGIVVSTSDVTDPINALTSTGEVAALEYLGQDVLHGLSFYRLTEQVLPPIDFAHDADVVGETFVAITLNPESATPRIRAFTVQDMRLPTAADPLGWQRLLGGPELSSDVRGAPVVTESGALAGLVVDHEESRILPLGAITHSFDRLTGNRLEDNPFTTIGIELSYRFEANEADALVFAPTVVGVTTGSAAAQAGVTRGDVLTQVADTPVSWSVELAPLLTARPLSLAIIRDAEPRTLTLFPE